VPLLKSPLLDEIWGTFRENGPQSLDRIDQKKTGNQEKARALNRGRHGIRILKAKSCIFLFR
jgi:hypothetical protein